MKNKKMILVFVFAIIALVAGLYFGINWLSGQMQAGQQMPFQMGPHHVRPPH